MANVLIPSALIGIAFIIGGMLFGIPFTQSAVGGMSAFIAGLAWGALAVATRNNG